MDGTASLMMNPVRLNPFSVNSSYSASECVDSLIGPDHGSACNMNELRDQLYHLSVKVDDRLVSMEVSFGEARI